MARHLARVARERAKDDLRDILRTMRIAAKPPQGGVIHEGQVAPHHLGEGVLVPVRGVAAKQCAVVNHSVRP